MSGQFEVLFHGEVYASVDPDQAQADMAKLFRQSPEAVKRLFSGKTWVLKDGLDRETAERYQVELAKIGLISELKDRAPAAQVKPEPSPHGKSQNFTIESIAIARMTCPACNYEQLEADYCARCGANIASAKKQVRLKEKEDRIIQERIQALRKGGGKPGSGATAPTKVAPPRIDAPPQPMPSVAVREPSGGGGLVVWLVAGIAVAVIGAGLLVALGIIDLPI
ncbi:MAG: hypothetical protein JJT88_20010 [Gammaproteobacteria bacterium]|nr:hypothetical protein [Gammaproteobacteria bacterium]